MSRSMNFDVTANDNASREFLVMAQAAERLETKLKHLDRLRIEPTAQLNITPATRSAAQLQSRLDALRNVRTTVQVDGAAEARRDVSALVVEIRKLRNARVRVDIDGNARTSLTALTAQLRALRDVKVKVSLDDGTFARDIARLHQRVSALRGTTVRIDFDLRPPGIQAELASIVASLRALRGTTRHRVDVDTNSASAAVARLGSVLGKLGKSGAVALSIPGIVNLIGQVGSLGSSVLALTGILGLVPAAGIAAGVALGTVAIGLQGLGDALGPTGTAAEIEKVNAAMAKLSPEARALVTEIRALGPAWEGTRLEVQERLLAGLGAEVQQLGAAYLPTLRTQLGGVATELNSGVRMWSDWAGSAPAVADLNTILGNTRTTLRELAPAGTDLAAALTDVSVVGSELMPELAGGATQATGRFREFIAEARRTGELEQWIRGGIATMEQLGRITVNTGGILGSVFSASEEAGYGFLDLVEEVTAELDTLLSSTSGRNALVALFSEARDVSRELLPGLRDLTTAALDTVSAFARSDGLQEFAAFVSQTASTISPLVSKLGQLGGETLGDLSGGASVAVAALSPLVGLVGGVTDGLGSLVPLALAAVIAFKGLALVTPMVVALGTSMQVAAVSAAMMAGSVTGSATAAALAGGATLRAGSAMVAFGKALPLIAVGAVLVGQAVQAASGDLDGWAAGMIAGGEAARKARADFEAHNAQFTEGSLAAGLFAKSEADLTAEINNQIAALGPLEQAQARAQLAQTAYNDAVRDFGSGSSEARAAAANLASATDAVTQAQFDAEQATRSYSERLRDQASAAQTAIGANLQLEDALARVAQAERDANTAAAEHGAGSEQAAAAAREYVTAADQAAQSARAVAESLAASAGPAAQADAGTAAYGATLLNLAASASGPARDALLGHLSLLSQTELDSLSAGAAALGFATQIIQLPDGKTVTIAIDPETGEIVSTQQLLDGMRDGDAAINLETQQALADLDAFIGVVNGAGGSVNIDGNPMAAGVALQTVLGQIAAGAATVTINGQAVPAADALSMILNQIQASGATVTINGQNVPAAGVLRDTLAAIAAGQETVTINGQSVPARGALGALLRDVGLASAIMSILGRDGGVQALKNRLSTPSSSTHTIYVRTSGGGVGQVVPGYGKLTNHDGNLVPAKATRFHDGGVAAAYASGGMRPFRAGTAQVFPPRLLRITGDRTDVDEFYIPDNAERRSMSLGTEWARRRGMNLVPRNTSETMTVRRGGSAQGPAARQITSVMSQARGTGGATVVAAPVDLRPLAAELRTFVQAALGRSDQAAVVAAVDRLGHALAAPRATSAEAHRLFGLDGVL